MPASSCKFALAAVIVWVLGLPSTTELMSFFLVDLESKNEILSVI